MQGADDQHHQYHLCIVRFIKYIRKHSHLRCNLSASVIPRADSVSIPFLFTSCQSIRCVVMKFLIPTKKWIDFSCCFFVCLAHWFIPFDLIFFFRSLCIIFFHICHFFCCSLVLFVCSTRSAFSAFTVLVNIENRNGKIFLHHHHHLLLLFPLQYQFV